MPNPSADHTADLHTKQHEFAAHLRDPLNNPAPSDVEDRRMAIYRDLFFNNVRSLLASNFPLLSKILGEERWKMLVRDFYRDHESHSPLFPDVPREFLHYLTDERPNGKHSDAETDLPFMYELAHYEWVEAGLKLAQDLGSAKPVDPAGDLLEGVPVCSNVAWLLAYNWPVNEIGPAFQPAEPNQEPLYYLIYRNADFKVIFLSLNAVSARLFEILDNDEVLTGRDALLQVATELQHPDASKVVAMGADILRQWHDKGIVLGIAA